MERELRVLRRELDRVQRAWSQIRRGSSAPNHSVVSAASTAGARLRELSIEVGISAESVRRWRERAAAGGDRCGNLVGSGLRDRAASPDHRRPLDQARDGAAGDRARPDELAAARRRPRRQALADVVPDRATRRGTSHPRRQKAPRPSSYSSASTGARLPSDN